MPVRVNLANVSERQYIDTVERALVAAGRLEELVAWNTERLQEHWSPWEAVLHAPVCVVFGAEATDA